MIKTIILWILKIAAAAAFLYYTGIKGFIGFVVGAWVSVYLVVTDNSKLMALISFLRFKNIKKKLDDINDKNKGR